MPRNQAEIDSWNFNDWKTSDAFKWKSDSENVQRMLYIFRMVNF